MLTDVRTLQEEPQPGVEYLVPCVELLKIDLPRGGVQMLPPGIYLPVLGFPHADPDLGAARRHHHSDERFVQREDLPYLGHCQAHRFLTVVDTEDTRGPATLQPRVCQRRMPLHPTHRPQQRKLSLFFLAEFCARGAGCLTGRLSLRGHEALEARFEGKQALDDRCPHWGTPLSGQRIWTTAEARKVRICPSHALCFEVETGLFVPSPDIELSGEDDPYGTLGELRARLAGLRQAPLQVRDRAVATEGEKA